jgi:hypothetical protein
LRIQIYTATIHQFQPQVAIQHHKKLVTVGVAMPGILVIFVNGYAQAVVVQVGYYLVGMWAQQGGAQL